MKTLEQRSVSTARSTLNSRRLGGPPAAAQERFDYATMLPLHHCECGGSHALRPYPVGDSFVVAVCCTVCFSRGLPTRFSTETKRLHTRDQAERSLKALLRP